jgi:hypothetical protein
MATALCRRVQDPTQMITADFSACVSDQHFFCLPRVMPMRPLEICKSRVGIKHASVMYLHLRTLVASSTLPDTTRRWKALPQDFGGE